MHQANKDHKKIAVLGSTGSIGTQTLDIVRAFPDKFKISVLTANNNWELLLSQAKEFLPKIVVIRNETYYSILKEHLKDYPIEVFSGEKAIEESVKLNEIDIVLTALVGYSGLIPTIEAIKEKKTIALANKETLVVAGEIVTCLAKENKVKILPVDSEHSAIFQCLVGEDRKKLRRILLTASGGPFRTTPINQLSAMKAKDALKHPNWKMGAKVTIDSSSMMNKGFEMIEAKWLFDCSPDEIEILVHPQSLVHSMVEFSDGSIKAQLGVPDMRLPISYALGYPERLNDSAETLSISKIAQLNFEKPDFNKFPLLGLAYEVIKIGGNLPCILNAANEVGVKAFLDDKIKFTDLSEIVEYTLSQVQEIQNPTLADLIQTNRESIEKAKQWILLNSK